MDRIEALRRLEISTVGHLATVRPEGTPHLVPVTYAVIDNQVVTMVDHKPKTTSHLQRLANVEANGAASLLVDQYSDEWSDLWWVRVDGSASVHRDGSVRRQATAALVAKYFQYQEQQPKGPAIVMSIDQVSYWSSTS